MSTPLPAGFLELHAPGRRLALRALGFFVLLTALLRAPLLPHLSSEFLGGAQRDAALYSWLMLSNWRDLFHAPWFSTPAFYPYARTLAFSDNFILPSIVGGLLTAAGATTALAFNVLILGAEVLCGYCTFLLAYALSAEALAAIFAGSAFLSYGYLSAHLGHPQLQFAFCIPLFLLALLRFLSAPSFLRALLCGLLVSAVLYTTVYYAIFLALLAAVLLAGFALARPFVFSRSNCLRLLSGFIAGMLPMLPAATPYLSVQRTFGARATYEAHYFSASTLSYLSAPEFSLLYGKLSALAPAEAQLFPGLVVLVLAALSMRRLGEAKPLRSLYTSLIVATAVALVFSPAALRWPGIYAQRLISALGWWWALGSCALLLFRLRKLEEKLGFRIVTNRTLLGILWFTALTAAAVSCGPLGNETKHQLALGPFMLFYHGLPGFAAIRAISRLGVAVTLLLCILAACGLAQRGAKLRASALCALIALTLAENTVMRFPHEALPPRPFIFDQLDGLALGDEAVMVLPFAGTLEKGEVASWSEFARLNVNAMHWALRTRRFLVNGYSGQRTSLMRKWPAVLSGFPSKESAKLLASLAGLRYVVYLTAERPGFDEERFEKQLAELAGAFTEVGRDVAGNYLLEYTGQTRIDEQFELLVPPVSGSTLSLEMMALGKTKGEPVKVKLYEGPSANSREEIASFDLESNGDWDMVTVPLAVPSGERVRPVKISFATDAAHFLLLKQSRYAAKKAAP